MIAMSIIKFGQGVADVSATLSLFAAATADQATALAAAIISVGAIVVPRLIDWYKDVRATRREQHRLDLESEASMLAIEVRRRAELEQSVQLLKSRVAELETTLAGTSCPLAEDHGPRCGAAASAQEQIQEGKD